MKKTRRRRRQKTRRKDARPRPAPLQTSLHSPPFAHLPLGRLRGAHHPPQRVVQLPRLGQLALPPDGRVDAPQVREGRGVREPVEHLRHARAHGARRAALRAPVARRERVLEALADRARLDGKGDVDVAPVVGGALHGTADVLAQLAEQLAEQAGEQGAPQVEALVGVVVSVVLGPAAQPAGQQPVRHVPHEEGLARLAKGRLPHVRQQLFLQDLARVLDPLGARDADRRRALADIVERERGRRHGLRLLDRGAQGLGHLGVVQAVDHVLEDVAVAHHPQGAEEDE